MPQGKPDDLQLIIGGDPSDVEIRKLEESSRRLAEQEAASRQEFQSRIQDWSAQSQHADVETNADLKHGDLTADEITREAQGVLDEVEKMPGILEKMAEDTTGYDVFNEYKRARVRQTIQTLVAQRKNLSRSQQQQVASFLLDNKLGIGPELQGYLDGDDVREFRVNGPDEVITIRLSTGYTVEKTRFASRERLLEVARRIGAVNGRQPDRDRPLVDVATSSRDRVAIQIGDPAPYGPNIVVRKAPLRDNPITFDKYLQGGVMPPFVAVLLVALAWARLSGLIIGEMGSGKTTLLRALAAFFRFGLRTAVIEDTHEIYLHGLADVVYLLTREIPPEIHSPAEDVNMTRLIKAGLRMSINRIIVGEVRGIEVMAFLNALNIGSEGSWTTIHANSAKAVLMRIVSMINTSGMITLDREDIVNMLYQSNPVGVHIQYYEEAGARILDEVMEFHMVSNLDGEDRRENRMLARFEFEGIDEREENGRLKRRVLGHWDYPQPPSDFLLQKLRARRVRFADCCRALGIDPAAVEVPSTWRGWVEG